MDELRVVRRDDRALIVASETGDEYRLVVDASVLAELRHLARQLTGGTRVSPREIQALVRAGKTRQEICEITGADESDVERYEEPVLAERRFILSSAQQVPVRTSPSEQNDEQFGSVIAERLISLQANDIDWSAWRDEEAGWMVGLTFESNGAEHRAVWGFEHRKSLLTPLTPDAVSLSKQGDVGDRLIPKLRAVDDSDARGRFDSDAFERESLPGSSETGERRDAPTPNEGERPPQVSPGAEAAFKAGHPSTGSIPVVDSEAEFARRREIDHRAIKTTEPELPDLGQTADLLEALRRRRGEREEWVGAAADEAEEDEDRVPPNPVPLRSTDRSEHGSSDSPVAELFGIRSERGADLPTPEERVEELAEPEAEPEPETPSERKTDSGKPESGKRGRGRTSIPSWDDILFGTRGDDD